MPGMISCIYEGDVLDIQRALNLRSKSGKSRPKFFCISCKKPVRAHKAGGLAGAHFEHLKKNPSCELIR